MEHEQTSPGVIRRIRRQTGVSQRRLADLAGVSKSTVARWETGQTSPSLDIATALADLAGLRLVLVSSQGDEVAPMRSTAVKDLARRRYPAHLDPRAGASRDQFRPGRRVSGVTFDRGFWHRLARRGGLFPGDHPTWEEISDLEQRGDVDERITGVDDRRLVAADHDSRAVRPHEPQRLAVGVEQRAEPFPFSYFLPEVRLQVEDSRAARADPAA